MACGDQDTARSNSIFVSRFADALYMQVQRLNELYAETNQVGFIGRLETDGAPVLEEAFVRLKLA